MITRRDIAQYIREAREKLYLAGRNDYLRAVRNGDYRNIQEAMAELGPAPTEPTAAEVEAVIDGWVADAESIRMYVREHGEKWSEKVRARWLASADEKERNYRALKGGP